MKGRLFMISLFVLLIIGTVIIFGSAISNSNTVRESAQPDLEQEIMINQEGGVFKRSALAPAYKDMPEGNRTMANYYDNRAYPGAPPMIVHPLISEKGIGGKACLQCHQNGGYVPQFSAFAPVTPHPEWLNCRQCHLPMKSAALFKQSNWEKPAPPKLGVKALSTSPMVMPHGLQNRGNCLSCHAGPAAPKEIKVTHPERINCRQCHVPSRVDQQFFTPIESRSEPLDDSRQGALLKSEPMNTSKVQEISQWVRENGEDQKK